MSDIMMELSSTKTPPFRPSLRDRVGTLLRENRLVTIGELLLVPLLILLRLPTATIPLLLIGWLSLWLRRSGWQQIGMRRPADWQRTLLLGISAGAAYQSFSIGLLVPFLHRLTGAPVDLSQLAPLRGNLANLAISLILSWTLAAFGEELVFRGYVFNRLADVFGRGNLAWGVSVVLSAALFALGHSYQGITGAIENFVFGAVLAGLYLIAARNLWLSAITHGVVDTTGFILIFLGLYP